MEVQFLSDSESHQINYGISYNHKQIEVPIQENQLQSRILSLVQKGYPVFIYEQRSQTQNQNQILLQQTNKQTFLNEKILTYNRKAKSLEQLSKKFIDHFEGRGNNIIQLDKITNQLGVQRRRIYDIINILESLNVVKKKGKNNYQWKGLHQAVRTINQCSNQPQNSKIQNMKKEKSLEYLASGFLNLFINWKPAISLEEAAKEMMKETDEAVIKTKIRRLYDIINVFRSLGLVRKSILSSKRPGYEWAGTDFLERLIVKKQENDQNTRLNELNNFEEVQNNQQKSTPVLLTKRSSFSPLICPLLQKPEIVYLKQMFQTKEQVTCFQEQTDKNGSNQQFSLQKNQFPIFHRSTSAFSLVNSDGKDFQ